jgi:hypothetical protein
MTERAARAIVKTVHEGQKTAAGSPVFDHVGRVADAVPRQARVTAWLHDVMEQTDLTIGQLRVRGVSPVELRNSSASTPGKGSASASSETSDR